MYKCSEVSPISALQKKFNLKDTTKEGVDFANLSSFKSIKEMQYFCLKMKHKGYCKYCLETFWYGMNEWTNNRIPFKDHLASKEQEELFCANLEESLE